MGKQCDTERAVGVPHTRVFRAAPPRARRRAPPRGARDSTRAMAPARRGSFDRGDADARGRETDSDDGDERRHHTLTLAQGRALRRELSRHTLHALGGERVLSLIHI